MERIKYMARVDDKRFGPTQVVAGSRHKSHKCN